MIDLTTIVLISILLLFFILIYLWRKIFILQKELKREAREARESLETSFDKLLKKVEKEIEFLDGQPGLSEDEKKLRDKLFEAIESSKEIVKKEIEDVEKKSE